jgi:hypothetical protein
VDCGDVGGDYVHHGFDVRNRAMTKYLLLIFGFMIAVMPSMIAGVWNGQSFLGLVICLIAGGWILRSEALDRGL